MKRYWTVGGGMLIAALLGLACDNDCADCGEFPPSHFTRDIVEAFANLTFSRPVDIQNAGDGSNRLFVLEQIGHIRVFDNDSTVAASTEFLDLTGKVTYQPQSETGLLGLAFHPQYATNGYFFVYYTFTSTQLMSRLSRFSVSAADSNVADPASEKILLEFSQDYPNHNGGGMCFDGDGYLCLGVGDEGSGGDPKENAQNIADLHGKILRFDVNQNVNTAPYYGIPADNPFAGNTSGYREEIYAYGMRNPWRISYDAQSDRLWAGDVGQNTREEIDIITNGGNFGWDCREGLIAYTGPPDGPSPECATASGFVDPVFDYPRSEGQSITGGYVYRGSMQLWGRYIYADYISGRVWALSYTGGVVMNTLIKDTNMYISTLGVGEDDELFMAGYLADGTPTVLYKIKETVSY